MPTIQSLVKAQMHSIPGSESSDLSHDQLQQKLEKISCRLALFDATERVARIGHYEWSRVHERLEFCSAEYASLFNMTVEETLAAQSTLEMTLLQIHPEDREHYMRATHAMEVSKTLEVEFRILLEDGSIKHIRESAVSTFDTDGVDTGSFGLMQDITRQVRYERDLESRDELARQSEEITDIGHFIYDEDNECYLYLSEGCARIHGHSVDYFMENVKSFSDDICDVVEEDRQRVADEYRHYRENGQNCAIEYRIRRADGAIRWVRELGRPRGTNNGRVSETLGVMQDITDQVLREQESTFKEAMASQAEAITDIGYFMYDVVNSKHQFVSWGQARIVGMGVEEFLNKIRSSHDYIELIYAQDRERIRNIYLDAHNSRDGWQEEYRIRRADGELRWVREIGKAYKRNGEQVELAIGVVQDITEQKKIEQELRYKDALANQAEAITEIGHFVYDEIREKYLFANPGLARIFGKHVEDLVLRSPMSEGGKDVVHPDDREKVQKAYDRFMADGDEWKVDYRLLRGDGEVRWIREMGKVHLVSHGIPEQTIGVLQDITAQKNAEQEIVQARDTLEHQVVERTRELANTVKQLEVEIEEREKIAAELHFLANHDALTGLPSLRLCKDRLGHEFGDRVLRETAERITTEIRETDTVARIGGDEFVIILSSLPESTIANRIARSLVDAIARPLEVDSVEVAVSASIGISLYPENGVTAEELIRSADKAMYRIKRAGKNSFGFVESARL